MIWPDNFINKIIYGDCLEIMKWCPTNSVDMCITSPPYWGLRDYGTGKDQIGLEPTPELYIEHLTEIFSEVKQVLKKEGTFWLNMGDTYSGSPAGDTAGKSRTGMFKLGNKDQKTRIAGTKHKKMTLPQKCLYMIPERLVWSLIQDGWILRNKVVWYKPNAMPASVKDRFNNQWEYIFLFSKNKRYYFDLDSIREKTLSGEGKRYDVSTHKHQQINKSWLGHNRKDFFNHPLGKNPGDVWTIGTRPFPEAHFAVFPEKLCERPIKAGCPEGGIVLDPFAGAGTALLVARQLKRKFIGIDIKKEYCRMAEKRLRKTVVCV